MSENWETYEPEIEQKPEHPMDKLAPSGISAVQGGEGSNEINENSTLQTPEDSLTPAPTIDTSRSIQNEIEGDNDLKSLNDSTPLTTPEQLVSDDLSNPELSGNSKDSIVPLLEPSGIENPDFPLETPENIPERVTEKAVPHDPSEVLSKPRESIELPDGSKALITGDLNRFKDLNHPQGEVAGYEGTCGICAVQCVANEHGLMVSEGDVLNTAFLHEPPLCNIDPDTDSIYRGGTAPAQRAELLTEMNIPSRVESGKNIQDLSEYIDSGKSVILSTNAGYLWHDPSYVGQDPTRPNHAVTLIDMAHDPKTDEITGFFINDSGNYDGGRGSGQFIDLATMEKAWENTGGIAVVSDKSHRS